MSKRDEQFAGFARAVVEKMLSYHDGMMEASDWWQEKACGVVARAAYDLMEHTLSSTLDLVGNWSDPISIMCEDEFSSRIPDLPELPEEKSEC